MTLYPDAEPGWGELFDLEADPGEHESLFNDSAHRALRDRLARRLASRFPARPDAGTALIAKWQEVSSASVATIHPAGDMMQLFRTTSLIRPCRMSGDERSEATDRGF